MSSPRDRADPAADPPPSLFAPRAAGWQPFWAAAADAIVRWLEEGAGAPVAIVVPRGSLVAPVRDALRARLAVPGRPWVPPPIRPLSGWLDERAPAPAVDGLARTLELLRALDDAMPESLPARAPADRLAFAAGLREVLDAFALAGAAGRLDDPAWIARVTDAFGSAAAGDRLRDDLALLARIGRATAGDGPDPALEAVARGRRLAADWSRRGVRVAWIAWQPPEALEAAVLGALDAGPPASRPLRLEPDWSAIGDGAPLLRAAWPERFGDGPAEPLRDRRRRWREAPGGPVPRVLHAADREREAQLAAQWVHGVLATAARDVPPPRIAIVALDRWLARRVRALLERAGVLIDDREGWLLSTTVAATAAMGWLDAVVGGGYYDDLLAWLDSRFVRPPAHGELRAWIERRATRHRYLRGWHGLRGGEAGDGGDGGEGGDGGDGGEPRASLDELLALAERQAAVQPLRAHLDALAQAMRWAASPRRLAADAAGRQVLALLDALRRAAAADANARPIPPADFRALLALLLERHRFYGPIDSPVEMLTPIDAAGRGFDAAIVLGASDAALGAPPPPLPLVNDALRAMLGLPTAAGTAARQQRDLALLLSLPARAAITCRTDPADGTRPGAWIDRLVAILDDEPLADRVSVPGVPRELHPARAARPAAACAPLPARLPVGAIERLVACPFRFVAQDGWRLRERAEAIDVPGVRERGELVHEILERFHREAARAGLSPATAERTALRGLLVDATDAVGARGLASGGGTLGEIAEWRATLDAYLDWAIEDARAGWVWLDGESDGATTIAWSGAAGGRELRVEGRVDRVDAGPDGLRVVDYKLGGPQRLERIAGDPDRAAQLALYAWIVAARGEVASAGYLSLRRDRVRWIGLALPAAAVVDAWRERLPAYLARIDGGEPMRAWGGECDFCPSRGLCRKGHWT